MPQHKDIIHSSTNYSQFVFIEGNRSVNRRKIAVLKERIEAHNLLSNFPILTRRGNDGRYYVLDGQHRLTSAKEMGLPIFFTIRNDVPDDVIADIQLGNAWKPSDFATYYAARGNQHYQNLLRFVAESKVPVGLAAQILRGSTAGSDSTEQAFRSGDFEIKSWAFAMEVAAILNVIRNYSTVYSSRSYVVAAIFIARTGKLDAKRFAQKAQYHATTFVKCATWEQAAQVIERIYNWMVKSGQSVAILHACQSLPDPRTKKQAA